MGFPPAEVVAGVAEVLVAFGVEPEVAAGEGEVSLIRARELAIRVGPLPPERATPTLFHPRALLVLEGEGPFAERVKAAIRLKFLRVAG